MNSTTHVAAPYVALNGRLIQRCAVCGEKLNDSKNEMAPVRPDGSAQEPLHWPPMRLVRVTHGNPSRWEVLDEPADGKMPDDSCFDLIED